MKKGMKRFLGIVLAMVMVLSMSLTAFAATPDANGDITIPVTVTIQDMPDASLLPAGYTGPTTAGDLFNSTVTLNADTDGVQAMDFIQGTGVPMVLTGGNEYIQSVEGLGNIDVEFGTNVYKGYSWMIYMKAGDSVDLVGTVPSWTTAPAPNNWFESPLNAANVTLDGSQFFPYTYGDNTAGFTTSVEGIILKYVYVEMTW